MITQAVLSAARAHGIEEELRREAGSANATDEVPFRPVDPLWRAVHARAPTAFGIEVAHRLSRGALGGTEYAVRSSRTVGDGLRVLARYARLLAAHDGYELRERPEGGASLVYRAADGASSSVEVDFALAAVVGLLRSASGVHIRPVRVALRRSTVEVAPYAAFYGAPIELGRAEDELELDGSALALPMREADPALCALLDGFLSRELDERDPAQSLAGAVRAAIVAALPTQEADLEHVAARVGLSSRVLQKRLQQASTSFQAQLDRVRESLAKRQLLEPAVSLAGTAIHLGYSDVTAFHRAFKRWTGVTPGEYRRRAGRPPPSE